MPKIPNAMILSIIRLNVIMPNVVLSTVIVLNTILPIVIMLNAILPIAIMLYVILQIAIMLNVIMPNAIMPNVMAPKTVLALFENFPIFLEPIYHRHLSRHRLSLSQSRVKIFSKFQLPLISVAVTLRPLWPGPTL
jgi:hypothetical protein